MTDLGCACVCSMDHEGADVSGTMIITARKKHTCCECGEAISPGERYEVISGLWEGSWDRYKTCLPCQRIRDDLCSCGYLFGGLREAIWEALGFDYVSGEFATKGLWKDEGT